MDRDTVIEKLIEDDFRSDNELGGFFYLIMLNGFQGYASFTDDQLLEELKLREITV